MSQITVNGINAVSMTTFIPTKGVWFAHVDLDLPIPADGSAPVMPSGKVAITIAGDNGDPDLSFVGTIDAAGSGRFGNSGRILVLGGAGGWASQLPRQQFSQRPLLSSTLYQTTAAAIGETVNDPAPVTFDEGYERLAGPAARVFGDRQWFVDPTTGITNVMPWPAPSAPDDLQVLGYDPEMGRVEVATSQLLAPGLQLTDTLDPPRWDGTLTVVDIEQQFTPLGGRATLFTGEPGAIQSRLLSALTGIVRELSRRDLSRAYRYRVVSQQGATLSLQAVTADPGCPDSINMPVWTAPGVSAMFTPGQSVLVQFADGDPGLPRLTVSDPTLPIQSTIDATAAVNVGPSAPLVALGGTSPAFAARTGDLAGGMFPIVATSVKVTVG